MTFSIKKSFKDSWALFSNKKIYWKFVGANFLAIAGLYLAFGLSSLSGFFLLPKGQIIPFALAVLVAVFFALYFLIVNVSIPLSVYKTKEIAVRKLFKKAWDIKKILNLVGIFILLAFVVGVGGFALFWLGSKIHVLAGVGLAGVWAGYFAIRWAFALYALVDMNLGPLDALKKSNVLMKKNGWKFLGFVIIVSIVSILLQAILSVVGSLSPFVAQIVSLVFGVFLAPWFSLLSMSPYIQLTHNHQ